jgi:hypothetical protein
MVNDNNKVLIGIIVDVSSSMQKNWGNNMTKNKTKIEVIKDALNDEFKRLRVLYGNGERQEVYVFCLGIGFILPFKLISVELKDGNETEVNNTSTTQYVGVICDILALSEIVPSKEKLAKIKQEIHFFWNEKSEEFLQDIQIEEDTETILRLSIEDGLLDSKMKGRSILRKIAHFFSHQLEVKVIKEKAERLSKKLLKDVISASESIFKENQERYKELIKKHITDFANRQIQYMLQRNALGFSLESILNHFDKAKMRLLAELIYNELRKDVFKEFKTVWLSNRIDIIAAKYVHFSRLDIDKIRALTEQMIKNIGWKSLKPFVEKNVFDIFSEAFEKISSDSFRNWLELASKREVVRNISDMANVLPDTTEKTIYSKEYMFGGTPMVEAVSLASLRFLDPRFKDYQKRLLIISDGEFRHDIEVKQVATLLQSEGVVILCGYVGNHSVIDTLMDRFKRNSNKGAQNLMDIASTIEQFTDIVDYIERGEIQTSLNNKLCIQINHPKHLASLVESITANK